MKIMVSGLLNIETTVAVRGFPIDYYPIDYPFFGVDSDVSGVGYNIAKALKTLSDDVTLLSYLGGDEESSRVMRQLGSDGIGDEGIVRSLGRTPASVVLYDPDGRRQIYCDLKDIQDQRLDTDKAAQLADGCEIAAVCNINFNRGLAEKLRAAGITTATDVHVLDDIDNEYNRYFMENADILFLSDEKLPCAPEEFIRRLAGRYHNRVIVIGMGGKGAMLYDADSDKLYRLGACRNVKVVNTVGAGDALFASFLHFSAKGYAPLDALMRAQVFAGIKIGYSGASRGFCTEAEIEAKLPIAEISIEEL